LVSGDEALAEFRGRLTGPFALGLLAASPWGMIVQLPAGSGKTVWMVKIIAHSLSSGDYDLVVTLAPRWDLLKEIMALVPAGLRRVVLRPRPGARCGPLDELWGQYEQQGLGILGRAQLCGGCLHRAACFWPGQFGSSLRGARLIFATQQHLVLNPNFILHLQQQTRAANPLILVDESDLLLRPAERLVRAGDLQRFRAAQEACVAAAEKPTALASEWLELTRLLALAPTPDLREGRWRFPWVDAGWAADVQARGLALFGPQYKFLGFELHHLGHSDPPGRERLPGGDIRFTALPYLGKRFVVFTGSLPTGLARYRLDPNHDGPGLTSPFEGHHFECPATKWININSLAGAAKFFPKNAGRILDFFAALVGRNIAAGRRTLLVARKKFVPLCRRLLRERLAGLGVGPVKVVSGSWQRHDLHDPRVLALINFGMLGVNIFEHIESAYCLCGYYVTPEVVSQAVQDIEATTERYPVRIVTAGDPRRRRVEVQLPDARLPILPWVAQQVLRQREADVVLQGVARVRPFTRAREVITFQCDSLPNVRYTLEFRSLEQARKYFQIQTPTQASFEARVEQVRRLKAQGYSKGEIAQALSVSVSTVKRYLRRAGGHQPFF
jgi:DNA-binding NarL/FixJ family response regulator